MLGGDRRHHCETQAEPACVAAAPLVEAVLIGLPAAIELWGVEPAPTTIYVRARPETMDAVSGVLARTVKPLAPNEVAVTRPADALEARGAVDDSLARLLVGLGAVAVVVAALGVLNVMLVAVLERRQEIGIRRALGATRAAIAGQFLTEAAVLTTVGGVGGLGLGAGATAVGAARNGWTLDLPVEVAGLALVGAAVVGVAAGLHPAWRAVRLDPAEAVRSR